MGHDAVCNRHWGVLYSEFAEFQLALCDVHGAPVAAGFTIPLAFPKAEATWRRGRSCR